MTDFGIYVHIPFCRHRCDYCAFATWTDRDHLVEAYVRAVITDIERAVGAGMPAANTVFFGGGTPTRIAPELLVGIVDSIPVNRADSPEVTVECNPDDVTPRLMEAYASAGVTRVSIGVQSMEPRTLALLGRTHTPANVATAVAAARGAGIDSVNLDLIYGARGETLEHWRETVLSALEMQPSHVSAYALTVEAGTPLAHDPGRHPDDDDLADKYLLADELFSDAGLENYEISNWSLPGQESRHNSLYWSQGNYRGFGCAAHSHDDGRRWWNVRTPERYIDLVNRGLDATAGEETLDPSARTREKYELAVRTRDGVPVEVLNVDQLDDLVEVTGNKVVLTRRGRLLANEVSLRLDP